MNKKAKNNHTNPVFEELEARLLLSADPLGVIAEPSLAALQNTVHVASEYTMMVQNHAEQSPAVVLNNSQSSNRAELVIIDSRAPNFQQLHNDVIMAQQQGRNINVLILDAHRDGIEQISEALSKYDKLDAVHIVSHGNDAQLQLGAIHLNQQNLQQRSDEISKWQDVFTEGGDLLIYGCDLAGSSKGTALANSLGQLTGADVAASDDLTGNARLGGDWDLEYTTGEIETKVAFSLDIQQNWQGTLEGPAATAAAEENAANEEQRQQELLAQEQLEQQEAALTEEEQAAASQNDEQQQAVIAEEQRQEIVVIDESVTDFQSFIDDLTANNDEFTNFEILLLDGDSNGIQQINDALSNYNDIDALHIISHGGDGAVRLGNTLLNDSNIDQYSDSLTAWGSSLDLNADILIYGCNLAESSSGEQFVDQLAQLTGADVAASDDLTGHASLGGDWDLEYSVGSIEADVPVDTETRQEWAHLMAAPDDLQATSAASGGLSLNTDGGNDAGLLADVGIGSSLNALTTVTLEATFSIASTPGDNAPLISYADGANDEELALFIKSDTANGTIMFRAHSTGTPFESVTSPVNLFDGNIHHVAVSWDATNGAVVIYVDGAEVNSITGYQTGQAITGGGRLVIGQDQDSVLGGYDDIDVFSGTLYDIRIFDDVRTATEITDNYNQSLIANEPGLIANWNFNDLSTSGVVTDVVNGYNLTVIHVTGTGFTASTPELTFSVNENSTNGTVVGTVTGNDADRQAQIATLLAADPDLTYSAETGKFYKVVTAADTWSNSQTAAIAQTLSGINGQLVTIHSAAENEIIQALAAGQVWIGGSDLATEGDWRWYDGATVGEQFWSGDAGGSSPDGLYTNWNPGEPDNLSTGDHVFLATDGTWWDSNDSHTISSVVEWDADTVLDVTDPLTYSIQSQTVAGAFTIDADSGEITVADGTLLDYETDPIHTLTIRVSDGSTFYDEAFSVSLVDQIDVPVNNVPSAQSTDEDVTLVFSTANGNPITVGDDAGDTLTTVISVANGTLTVSGAGSATVSGDGTATVTLTGSVADINAALEGLQYDPASNYNGSDTLTITTTNVFEAGLLGHYQFDTSDPAGDTSPGGTNDGTLEGDAVEVFNDPQQGDVLSLGGSSDYVQVTGMYGNPADVTLAAWINLDTAGSNGAEVISLGNNVILRVDDTNRNGLIGAFHNGTDWNEAIDFPSNLAATGWHHVAFTFDDAGNAQRLYFDGALVASGASTSSIAYGQGSDTYIGTHGDGSLNYDFKGLIDDARIYDRALTASEISALALPAAQTTASDTVSITVDAVNDAPTDIIFDSESAAQQTVNTYGISDQVDPAIAAFDDGGYIVVWSSNGQDGDNYGIYGQRYNADATTNGAEFLVTSETTDLEGHPSVASFSDGGFVVTWQDQESGVMAWTEARVFNADGTPAAAEFTVSPGLDPSNEGYQPAVVALNINQFVVVWSNEIGNATYEIAGQIYDRSGALVGSQFSVGSTLSATALYNAQTEITQLEGGGFAVVWQTNNGSSGVSARVMNDDGSVGSAEIIISGENFADIASLSNGNFVVTYDSAGELKADIYDASGVLVNGAIAVNSTTSASFYQSTVTSSDDGFVVVWESSTGDGDGSAILAQRFDASGNSIDGEVIVNQTTTGNQQMPEVIETAFGQVIAVWQSENVDAATTGIASRVLATGTASVNENAANGTRVADVTGVMDIDSGDTHSFSLANNAGGRFEINATTGEITVLDGTLLDYETATSHNITVRVTDSTSNTFDEVLTIQVTDVNDAPTITTPVALTAPEGRTNVATISATDDDGDTLTFSITGGVDQSLFGIDSTTGNLFFNSVQDYENPGDANGDGVYQVTVDVNDGVATTSRTFDVTLTDVSEPSVDVAGPQTIDENTALVFSTANGNPITVNAGAGDTLTTVISVANGTLTVSGAGSATVSGDGTAAVTLTGSVDDINAALDGLGYDPTTEYNGTDTLSVTTTFANLYNLDIDASLLGRYQFDISAPGDDTSPGGTLDGTLTGNATVVNDPEQGDVLSLDGSGDYVQVTGLYGEPADVTLAAWINLEKKDAWGAEVISLGNNMLLRVDDNGSGGLMGTFWNGTDYEPISSTVLLAGTGWHHVAFTFDDAGNAQSLYLDGALVASGTFTGSIDYGQASDTYIGTHADGGKNYEFNGMIDDARVYDRALSASEISALALISVQTSAADTVSITVNAVNDAPLATNLNAAESYTEDTSLNLTDIVVSDIDSTNVTVTLTLSDVAAGDLNTTTSGAVTSTFVGGVWTASGAIADVNTLLAGVTFTPTLNYSSDFSIATSVDDGVAAAITGSKTMTATTVNDAPAFTALDGTPTFIEGSAAVVLDADVDIRDAELDALNLGSGNYEGTSLTLVRNAGAAAEDTFAFNDGNGITFSAGNLIKNLQIIATFDTTTTAGQLVITFTDGAGEIPTSTDVDNILRQISYANSSDAPPASVQINWTFNDGNTGSQGSGGALTATGSTTLSITGINSAPEITTPAALTALEGQTAVATITATDVEGDILNFSITGGTDQALFSITMDGELTFSSAKNYESPVDVNLDGVYEVEVTASDGAGTNTRTFFVTVTDAMETPQVNVPLGTSNTTLNEDAGPLIFNSANSNQIWISNISDSDIAELTLSVPNGVLTLSGTTGLTFTQGDGSGDSAMTFYGTAADINAALDGMEFQPDTDYAGTAQVSVTVTLKDQADPDPSQVAKYTFEIPADLGNDTSASGANDATIVNDPTVMLDSTRGNVLEFDGDDYLQLTTGDLGVTDAVTLSAWIDLESYDTNGADIISMGDDIVIRLLPDDRIQTGYWNGSNFIQTTQNSGVDFDAGGWFHLAYTVEYTPDNNDRVTTSFYINGVFASGGYSENTQLAFHPGRDTFIGTHGNAGTGYNFNGRMDDVRIYNRALTAGEVAAMSESNTQVANVTVTAVNDAPTATNLSVAEAYTEDTALNLTDIVVSDVDSTDVTVTLTLSDVDAGTLNTATSGSVTSTFVGGVWTASGAIADVNALLAGVTLTPSLNYNSNFSIATSVDDGVAAAITGSKAMTATAVNDAPQATNLSAAESYTEDTALNLTNIVVSDVDSANVTVTLTLSDMAAGTLNTATSNAVTSTFVGGVWTASGAIADVNTLLAGVTFTPSLNYNSNFSIATSVDDGVAAAITGSKAMTATAVNDMPVANVNTVATTEDIAYSFAATDFTFSDAEGDSLVSATITNLSLASGTLTHSGGTLVASGMTLTAAELNTLIYTPAASANGSPLASFDFSVNDADLGVAIAQMSINVTAVNNAPTATNLNTAESYTEDTALNLTDIVISDIDSTNVTVSLSLSDVTAGTLNTATSGLVTSTFVGGVWTASGAIADVNTLLAGVTLTPSLNYNSNFSIATSVDDGIAPAITGSKAITATAVNDVPTATNLSAAESYTEDTALNLTDIVVSDIDSASVTVTLTLSDMAAGTLNTATSNAVTSTFVGGVWTASGAIADVNTLLAGVTFTPSLNYNSNFSIATSVDDGVAAAITGSKAMTATAVNDMPVAAADNFTVDEGSTTILNLAFNDTDVDDGLDLNSIVITGAPANGSLLINGDGTVTYTHNGSETLSDSFSYTVSDITGAISNTATVTLTITPQNDAPTAVADGQSVNEGASINIDLASNDVDVDNALDLNSVVIVGAPVNGTLIVNGDGTVDYIHDGSETLSDSFSYTIADISGAISNVASVNITVNSVNDVPVATANTVSTTEDNAYSFAASDFTFGDAEGDAIVSATISNLSLAGGALTHSGGTVVISGDTLTAAQLDTLIYTPTANANGSPLATFDFTVNDTGTGVVTAQMDIDVTALNDVPVATANTVSTTEDNAYSFAASDFTFGDAEGDAIVSATITNLSLAGGVLTYSGGTVVISGDTLTAAQLDTLIYTPTANANGSPLATFDFTVNDTGTGVVTAQMDIDVTAVNNAPATIGIVDVTVNEDSTATSIDLNAAFDDPDNLDSELTYSITGNTNIGLFSSAAVNAATGELVLNYAADMNGSSQISMRATDPAGAFVDTLFTVTVTPVNDAPILVANTGATAVGTNPTVISSAQLNTNDVDNTNTEIVYTVTTLPTNGELLVNGVAVTSFTQDDLDNNRVSYQANGASVSDQFGFTVSDGAGGTILGNSFNILVQLAPTEPTDPVEPEVPTEPEEPDPGTTPTEPVVEVTPVNPEEPTDDYGSGFTPIGNNNPAETEPERIPEENFDEFENIDVPQVNNELTEYKIDSNTEYREIQVKSIKALFTAMDQMKDQMDEKVKENMASVEFTAAAVSSSGVALTAGAVAWVLRSGALMTSLMAVMPVWRGYDPLPILNYRENEDDENLTEDKIPTSLEELIKIKALKDKMNKENQLDSLFGTSAEGREGTNV